ncbi:MAG: CBS domain-containing protein [Brevinematales bacterium]|nr:CBS domain-containing protein [Brevinematales bacterium]
MIVSKTVDSIKATDLMTTDFFVCKENFSLFLAIDKVMRKKVHSIVVVDDNGSIKDIISTTDLLKVIFLEQYDVHTMRVGEIMKKDRDILYIDKDTGLVEILRIMKSNSISTLIVADNKLRPVGIVHIKDVLKIIEQILS